MVSCIQALGTSSDTVLESSIIVATRSRFLPSFGSNISSSNSQFDLGQDNFSNSNSTMDEACDEDPAVDLCEIRFDSSKLNATTLSKSFEFLKHIRKSQCDHFPIKVYRRTLCHQSVIREPNWQLCLS